MAEKIKAIIGHSAYQLSEVCSPDPKLGKCQHFADAAEKFTLTTRYWSETHSMDTGYYRDKSSHVCRACLPEGVEVVGL